MQRNELRLSHRLCPLRFVFSTFVLSLFGRSRTDWSLINILNGCDHWRIHTGCSECVLQEQKFTVANQDYDQTAAEATVTQRHFLPAHLEIFVNVHPVWTVTIKGASSLSDLQCL